MMHPAGTVAKVLVIGDVYTGKTSLIRRYAKNTFVEDYQTTIGVDFSLKTVSTPSGDVIMQLWDIAGQERFQGLQRIFYTNALAAIVVYDLFNKNSFQSAAKWKKDVDQKVFLPSGARIPVLLLGNKCDLIESGHEPEMSKQMIEDFAREHKFFAHFAVSAKTGEGVVEACDSLVAEIAKNNKTQMAAPKAPEEDTSAVKLSNNEPPAESGGCC